MPALSAYRWRKGAGQPAFRLARKAEDRDDWATVVATCTQALAADPGHLDAAWLLAVGYAKLGQPDRVLAPLSQAVAGDFGKWGPASLEHPALRAFLATPTGNAWRRRVEQDRARYVAAIARSLLVTADGDLHAVEVDGGRWYRLTRTTAAVIGALAIPSAGRIAYVSRTRHNGKHELGVGVIDLARGTSSRPVPIGTAGPITIAHSAKPPVGFWIGSGGPRPLAWRQLDDEYRLHPLPARTARPPGPWLDVTAKGTVRLHALPPGITADWDDQSLASAIRIGTSNRVVSVPSPGLIDGNTAAWSPDRVHLAFVAQLDDHCAPGAVNTAAFIADASTGGTRELERAARGIALVWLADRTLAIAGDHGVTIRSLDEAVPAVTVEGATGLLIPRERPRCAPVEATDEPPSDEPDLPEPAAGDEPPDAGVVDAR
ncbi:MAG TPA: hypothetical protein VFT22_39240 [Kofleriaceae bacterium]|nr:hypothetical protein [Kofleriaceae bacterium]